MTKTEDYRAMLRRLDDWDDYLTENSGLPGPRSNLELAQAVALEGNEACWARLRAAGHDAPTNTPGEFIAFCGVLGLGQLLAGGRRDTLATLRPCASDPRWRVREAVAMALQAWGRADMPALLAEMNAWSTGSRLEQRAVVAALCEPELLRVPDHASHVIELLGTITATLDASNHRSEEYRVLRQALGYGWSVAVVAQPVHGKAVMEHWLTTLNDPDTRWVLRENLKKNRLAKMDAEWVTRMQERLNR